MGFVDTDNIALNEKEVQSIIDLDLTNYPHLIGERDRFIVAYNFLLRFEDSIKVNKGDITEIGGSYFFNFKTGKTKEGVIIPVFKMTYNILEANNYALSRTTNQESNWKLKEIGRLAGINGIVTITEYRRGTRIDKNVTRHTEITTHTTRRSGATNMYLSGMPLKVIQILGGWKSIKQLERYIKIDKMQNAMKASEHDFFKNK